MRVLLDTHAYIWFLAGDERLSTLGRQLIGDPESMPLFSVASLWEIAIKYAIGKLSLDHPFEETFPARLERDGIDTLPIQPAHLHQLVGLPSHHRDPFDRLLIAQAIHEGLPILTRDRTFQRYAVETIWS